MELLQVGGGAGLVVELGPAELRATREELAHERAVEDLGERVRERGFGAREIADLARHVFERVERDVVDVGDERVAHPRERLIGVLERAVREARRATKERAARLAAVARAAAARRERLAERAPLLLAAGGLVALGRGLFEQRERLFGGQAREGELEEHARAIELTARARDLRGAREGAHAIRGDLAARDLALVEIDDLAGFVADAREALEELLGVRRARGPRGLARRGRSLRRASQPAATRASAWRTSSLARSTPARSRRRRSCATKSASWSLVLTASSSSFCASSRSAPRARTISRPTRVAS